MLTRGSIQSLNFCSDVFGLLTSCHCVQISCRARPLCVWTEAPATEMERRTSACAHLDTPDSTARQVLLLTSNHTDPRTDRRMTRGIMRACVVRLQMSTSASPTRVWTEPPVWTESTPSPASACPAMQESSASKVSHESCKVKVTLQKYEGTTRCTLSVVTVCSCLPALGVGLSL